MFWTRGDGGLRLFDTVLEFLEEVEEGLLGEWLSEVVAVDLTVVMLGGSRRGTGHEGL